jgi:hypothetical protein
MADDLIPNNGSKDEGNEHASDQDTGAKGSCDPISAVKLLVRSSGGRELVA